MTKEHVYAYEAGYLDGYSARESELVRCRDCDYYDHWDAYGPYREKHVCGHWDYLEINPDGFCAWGERKMNNKTGDFVTHDAHADDYKQAAEYWQRMYEETFAERTCRDASVDSSTQFYCSECECTVDVPLLWGEVNYCPNCGARVVG